jgi:uncharacterized protein (DUF58 family)
MFFGHQVDAVLRPGASRNHVLNLLRRMHQPRPAAKTARTGPDGTHLAHLLTLAESTMKRRGVVFVVSDFISAPGWQKPLARLAQRHEVVAVRLFDPLEMALPDVGLVTVEDAETGEQLFIDAADPAFRERYAAVAEEQEAQLIADLSASGADILELATDDDLLDALLRYADMRRQRARMRSGRRFPAHLQRARASSGMLTGTTSPLEAAP